jgi:hypothetical protein
MTIISKHALQHLQPSMPHVGLPDRTRMPNPAPCSAHTWDAGTVADMGVDEDEEEAEAAEPENKWARMQVRQPCCLPRKQASSRGQSACLCHTV